MTIESLRAALQTTEAVIAKQEEALRMTQQLRRQLVWRLIQEQHPHVTVAQSRELLRSYGIEP